MQLRRYALSNALARAGLARRTKQLGKHSFHTTLPWKRVWKTGRYFVLANGLFALLWIIDSQFITQSSERIYHYEQVYQMPAPFRFVIQSPRVMQAFSDEPLRLSVKVEGHSLPEQVHLVVGERRRHMDLAGLHLFSYLLEPLQEDLLFHFEANGYRSLPMRLSYVMRPSLRQVKMHVAFPAYTGLGNDSLSMLKNLKVPEGTEIRWELWARATQRIQVSFSTEPPSLGMNEVVQKIMKKKGDHFVASHRAERATNYELQLKNDAAENKNAIIYRLDVVPDEAPQLYTQITADTTFYQRILATGTATDDYGIRRLRLQYELRRAGGALDQGVVAVPFTLKSRARAVFSFLWPLDSLKLAQADVLRYRLAVWDNDATAKGPKVTHSRWQALYLPDAARLGEEVVQESEKGSAVAQSLLSETQRTQEAFQDLQERFKLKKALAWQDLKALKDLLDKRKAKESQVQSLKEQIQRFEDKYGRFDNLSEKTQTQLKQLRKVIDKVLDPETEALYQQLQRLLESGAQLSQVQRTPEKIVLGRRPARQTISPNAESYQASAI